MDLQLIQQLQLWLRGGVSLLMTMGTVVTVTSCQHGLTDLQLDEAARVVAVRLQGVLLVQWLQNRAGLVAEGLRAQSVEVEAQTVQQKLHPKL